MNESPNRNDPFRTQLEAYALGALDPDEGAFVREHLLWCPDCRDRLAELERVVAALPAALSAVGPHPPHDLKTQLLSAVADEPTSHPVAHGQLQPPEPAGEMLLVTATSGAESAAQRQRGPWISTTVITRLAAAAVLLLALGWSVRLAVALEQERAIKAEFAALVSQQEVVLEVVDSDKTVRRVLLTTDPSGCEPGACPYGKLFTRTDLLHVVAMAARLPSPPDGQSYRLWVTANDLSEPVGTLTLDDKGFGLLVFDAERAGQTYDRAALILQPDSSPAPDGDVVLLWTSAAAA